MGAIACHNSGETEEVLKFYAEAIPFNRNCWISKTSSPESIRWWWSQTFLWPIRTFFVLIFFPKCILIHTWSFQRFLQTSQAWWNLPSNTIWFTFVLDQPKFISEIFYWPQIFWGVKMSSPLKHYRVMCVQDVHTWEILVVVRKDIDSVCAPGRGKQ